jgi:hypothetical protein
MEWVKKEERYDLDEQPYTQLVCVVSNCPILPIMLAIHSSNLEDELDVSEMFSISINNCYDRNYRFKGNLEEAKEYAFDVVLRPYLDKLTSLPIFSK